MNMKVEIIWKEDIKPSSPTPNHLKHYKLSYLDQLAPPVIGRAVFLFESHDNEHIKRSNTLKMALAKTLLHFYPLAGRVSQAEEFMIECNDSGVAYREARIQYNFFDVVEKPDDVDLTLLTPYGSRVDPRKDFLLAVQYNIFDCGCGFAVGLSWWHKLCDGASVVMFFDAWASYARRASGSDVIIQTPKFDGSVHFPAKAVAPTQDDVLNNQDKIVIKRFIFNNSSIAALQEVVGSGTKLTRVEAVSDLITKRIMKITQFKSEKKVFVVGHIVNLRDRVVPPLLNTFGNIFRPLSVQVQVDDERLEPSMVCQLRNAISGIDGDYMEKLRKGDWSGEPTVEETAVERVAFTSLSGFRMYEVDFGWGKPTWANFGGEPCKNLIALFNTKTGDGIEAWIYMLEDDMVAFQHDPEIISFTSSSSSHFFRRSKI